MQAAVRPPTFETAILTDLNNAAKFTYEGRILLSVRVSEMHTYQQNYAEAFFSSGLYHPVCLLTADHATKKLAAEVSEDERIGAWLLRKNTRDHYIASKVEGNGAQS
jgi:hypothetical protein